MSITVTFTSSGTWICPAGVTLVDYAEAQGASGGSGLEKSGGKGIIYGGCGSSGGGYSRKNSIPVIPGNSYNVQVGNPGSASTGTDNATDGQDSYFIDSETLLAKGGGKGHDGAASPSSSSGGSSASGVGDVKYSGGNGSLGSTSAVSGAGGGAANTSSNGGNASGTTGGTSSVASGANGGTAAAAVSGNVPGGGSSGDGLGLTSGAVGARGEVRLTYTAPNKKDSGFFIIV